MNYCRFKLFSLAAVAATASLTLASCSNDEVEQINTGSEISFNSKVSRATVSDLSSLKEFYVYAQAEGSSTYFIENECATQTEKGSGIYKLGTNYYWPKGVQTVSFWAFGAAGLSDAQSGDKSPIQFNPTDKNISGVTIAESLTDAGKNQKDLVAAFVKSERPDGGAVPLTFKHAFSQIEIKARTGAKSVQRVYVKGVWLMNINSQGTMYFSPDGAVKWDIPSSSDVVSYGREFPIDQTEPEKVRAHMLPSVTGTNNENLITDNYSFMLLPQQLGAYNFTSRENGGSAYILFLCRIISEHKGELLEDFDNAMKDETNPNIHWHQLFPVNKEGNFKYGEYGYCCVPVDINWEPGKKYIYNIEFCGSTSGGGQYPPELPDGETFPGGDGVTIVPRPDGKEPGENVLDNPLSFLVTIEDWTEAPSNLPMH